MMTNSKISQIPFDKPWWQIIWDLKWYAIFVLICEVISSTFSALIPLMLGYIFSVGRYDLFVYFCLAWCIERAVEYARGYVTSLFELRIIYSVHYSAHRFFLEIDPLYHAQRASGAIIGKINRASRGYEDILDVISGDFLPMIISVIAVVVTLFFQASWLGLGAFAFLAIMTTTSILVIKYLIIPHERAWLRADDAIKIVSTENLVQVHLIRACFASYQMDRKLKERGYKAQERERKLWLSYLALHTFNKIIYIGPIIILGFYLFSRIKEGTVDSVLALSLLTTYLRGTRDILKLDKPIMKSIKAYTRINDLFDFIHNFGKQTYPVLEKGVSLEGVEKPKDAIIISAHNLHFDYHKEAKIFENHTLQLVVPYSQKIKLYGIIGPSGVGKSTLISILGGQLRPAQGTIFIDGVNIYAVNDQVRRRLIALQGQVSTNMRGTLRYNLLFGLPEDTQCYLDEHLIDVLNRVGLWTVFEHKRGLDTFIGEGGMNLSGGQRQRLNFASLYLRARYFKPHLILIDEPTSSLDEVSERAITDMILELASSAVTMVIAHRIRTLEQAVGLLDFSFIDKQKDLLFYSSNELLNKSEYYKKLVHEKILVEVDE